MKLSRNISKVNNYPPGCGIIILKVSDTITAQININLGRNGNWYVGNGIKLADWLEEKRYEIESFYDDKEV